MGADLNLVFAEKGAAAVLRELVKLKAEAKAAGKAIQAENAAITRTTKMVQQAYQSTLTPIEKLQQRAEKLRVALNKGILSDADAEKARKALGRLNGEIFDLQNKVEDFSGATEEADRSIVSAFGPAKTALLGSFATGAGAAAASVALVIKAVTDELRAAQELANKAEATQLSISASRNIVIRNLPGASDADIQRVLTENERLAGETGVAETAINQARAEALSASGGNIEASLKATRIAAQFLPDQQGEIGGFAGSLLDLSKVTGTTDAEVNLGLLSTIGGLSRVVDPQQQARNIPRALIGAKEFGFKGNEASAAFAALTTAGADLEGAVSGTALIQLAKQLEKFTPEELEGLSTGQKLRALQSNPELSAAFLEDASFEAKALGPVRQLLTSRASEAGRAYDANLSQLPSIEGLRAKGEAAIAAFDNNTLEAVARRSRGLTSAVEFGLTNAPQNILSDDAVAELKKGLVLGGAGTNVGVGLTLRSARVRGLGTITSESAASLVEQELAERTRQVEAGRGSFGEYTDEQMKEMRKQIALLEKMLAALESQNDQAGIPTDTQ